jgi:hypothetical protein
MQVVLVPSLDSFIELCRRSQKIYMTDDLPYNNAIATNCILGLRSPEYARDKRMKHSGSITCIRVVLLSSYVLITANL